jgi:CO/xanthine dehydrogenase Mo-binding subunit
VKEQVVEAKTRFVDDIFIRGSYFAVIIRSPVAHGRLKAIESPDMPNSYTLITARDIPGENHLANFPVPILASDTLSYIGEPVGILTGFDMRELEEYAAQCKVLCEEAPPLFASSEIPAASILAEREIVLSAVESAGGEAAENGVTAGGATGGVVSDVYKTGIQEHWYAEPHGAVVIPARGQLIYDHHPEEKNPLDLMVIHTATRWSDHVKRSVSLMLNVADTLLLVETSLFTINLDGKIWYPSLVACHAALAAHLIHRPIKLVLTREEDFRYTPKRNAAGIAISSKVDESGVLTETEITVRADLGAHGVFTNEILDSVCMGSLGVYAWSRLTLNGRAFSTNIPPQGPFAGFGIAQGFFAIERHVSVIADTLHQDPAQWRKDHIGSVAEEKRAGGVLFEDAPLSELIDHTALASDYYRKWASCELLRHKRRGKPLRVKDEPLRGIGIAVAYQAAENAAPDASRAAPAPHPLGWVAVVVEVIVDQISYVPKIRGVWLGVAAGNIVSEEKARRRLKTSVIHALGWASREKLFYERGKIPNSYLFSYDIPTLAELPPIHIDFVQRGGAGAGAGATIEELPYNSVPAAYVQAVSQAMDYPFKQIPLSASDVWDAEKARLQEHEQ